MPECLNVPKVISEQYGCVIFLGVVMKEAKLILSSNQER